MSLSASRAARTAAFLADTLLLGPVLALVFYPGYALWLPEAPKAPSLPLDLATPEEQLRFLEGIATRNVAIASLAMAAVAVFALAYFCTSLFSLRRTGQSFGMRASGIHVVGRTESLSWGVVVLRSFMSSIVSAGFVGGLVGLVIWKLLLQTPGIMGVPIWIVPSTVSALVFPVLCLLLPRSPNDLLSCSTLQRMRGSLKQG